MWVRQTLPVLLEVKKGEKQLAEEFTLYLVICAKASPNVPQENMKEMRVPFSLHSSIEELKIWGLFLIIFHCYCSTQLCSHCCAFCSRSIFRWRDKQKLYCHCVNVREMLWPDLRLLLEHVAKHWWEFALISPTSWLFSFLGLSNMELTVRN